MNKLAHEIKSHFTYPYRPFKVEIVGSVARGEMHPHDIDYLITLIHFDPEFLNKVGVDSPFRITEVDECGETQCYFKVKKNMKRPILVNLYLTDRDHYIFAKFGRLTDKGHLIHYKKLAADKGLLLNNTGLWDEDNKSKTFKTINQIQKYLDA